MPTETTLPAEKVARTCVKCEHSDGVDGKGWCLHNQPYNHDPATSLCGCKCEFAQPAPASATKEAAQITEGDKCGMCDEYAHRHYVLYKLCNNCWRSMPWSDGGRTFEHKPYPYTCAADNEILVSPTVANSTTPAIREQGAPERVWLDAVDGLRDDVGCGTYYTGKPSIASIEYVHGDRHAKAIEGLRRLKNAAFTLHVNEKHKPDAFAACVHPICHEACKSWNEATAHAALHPE